MSSVLYHSLLIPLRQGLFPRPGVHMCFIFLQRGKKPTHPSDPLVAAPLLLGARVSYRGVRDVQLDVWVLHSSVFPLF